MGKPSWTTSRVSLGRGRCPTFCWPHFLLAPLSAGPSSPGSSSRGLGHPAAAEQKRACSRLGSNSLPQRSHRLVSAIWSCYA
jgi:hypothetical protein